MIIVGLTGSIAMGKTTVANFFLQQNIAVFSADQEVHRLYQKKWFLKKIAVHFKNVIKSDAIDRNLMSKLLTNKEELKKLESIVHPYIRKMEGKFLQQARQKNKKLVVLDIPLLYETSAEKRVDYVLVVSAPYEEQKKRALLRQNMTEEKFYAILENQISNQEKCQRADFVIDTGNPLDQTKKDVQRIVTILLSLA